MLAFAAPAHAGESEATTIEEIVVVGSLIKRTSVYDGHAPVQSLDAETIDALGAAQPVDLLKALTANTGSVLATQQTYLQGTSQFSLRGLGLSSTLTLLNGRRAGLAPVSNGAGHGFLDINTLPLAMIERVEILRDGASAIYGSQAVAGVANIVTRQDFEGVEVSVGHRRSINEASDLGFAAGFASATWRVNLFGGYYRQNENFRTEFDWMTPRAIDPNGDGDIVDGSFDSGRGSPGSFRRAVANADGTYAPFLVDGIHAPRRPDADCAAAGGYPSGALCRMDFSDQRTMIAAEERAQFFAEAEFDVADTVTLFAEVGHSANTITDRVGNMLLFNGNVEGTNEFFVPARHPFNFWTDPDGDGVLDYVRPEDWRSGQHEAVDVGYFGRPLGAEASAGNAGDERRRFDTTRVLLGVRFDLPSDWSGTFYAAHTASELAVRADRHWIAAEFARAIVEGRWNPFGTRLAWPTLITPKTEADDGLAPSHVGRAAANDEATRRRFETQRVESADTEQRVVEFLASGDVAEWSAGPVALAVGLQYRDLDYHQQPDPLNMVGGGPSGIREFPATAGQSVAAAFAESLLPVGSIAELQLALRHESYDRAGATTDPKIGTQVFLGDRLSLRASWGTSFQAPSVFQTAGNTTARTLSDPFRFGRDGVGRCEVDPGGTIISRGDNFNATTVLRGGTLRPQSAELFNIGILAQAHRDAAISLDYWHIDYRDVIAQGRSFQAILDDDCRNDGVANDPRVLRDSSGQLVVVTTDYENVGMVRTSGIDLNAHVAFATRLGEVRLNAEATLLTRFDVGNRGQPLTDALGSRNDTNGFGPTPPLRASVGITWRRGAHRANAAVRHIDSYDNDEVATLPEIDAWTTLDVQYAYGFDAPGGGEATLTLGATNLTDEDPPPLPSGLEGTQRYNLRPGFDGFVHDIKGRVVYVRYRHRF